MLMSDETRTFAALRGGRVRFPPRPGFLISWFQVYCRAWEIGLSQNPTFCPARFELLWFLVSGFVFSTLLNSFYKNR
jgi:hypothetical protein